jgi:hypothetical protein
MKISVDKSKLKPGQRISFIYWGPALELRNKRFTGDVKEEAGTIFIEFEAEGGMHKVELSDITDAFYVRKKKGNK